MRDDDVRISCFARLAILEAEFGEEIPYRGALDTGFGFRGRSVPFLNVQKGIHRAAVQRGPAALSVQTSYSSPYGDRATDEGYVYAYRSGAVDQRTTARSAPRRTSASHSSTSSARAPASIGRIIRLSWFTTIRWPGRS